MNIICIAKGTATVGRTTRGADGKIISQTPARWEHDLDAGCACQKERRVLMDVNKLIERLRTESLYKDKATLEIMDLCMEAVYAISKLQAENTQLLAELEQAKRERDAAVECIQFIATYLGLNSMEDIRKTIEAWESGLKEG